MSSVWEVLSAIDCNQHVDKKGKFSYLAWTWAWAMVKENFPAAVYTLEDDIVYPDGTMEVRVSVTIEDLSHTMWLPVLDFKNNAIANPNAFDVNSSRMRCLVKCLAMFGLGHYIYAGESMPTPPGLSDDEYNVFLKFLSDQDGIGLLQYMEELGESKCDEAYNRAPKGQKIKFKDSVKAVEALGQMKIDKYALELSDCANADDGPGVVQLANELTDSGKWLKTRVWARLNDIERHDIAAYLKAAKEAGVEE